MEKKKNRFAELYKQLQLIEQVEEATKQQDAIKEDDKKAMRRMKKQGILVAFLALLFIVVGTFAFNANQQRGFGPIADPLSNNGVRFHDRLDLNNDSPRNLNIFAENFGDQDVFYAFSCVNS